MLKRLQQGGRKSILANKWIKFTVRYSMNRFLRAGGGLYSLFIYQSITKQVIHGDWYNGGDCIYNIKQFCYNKRNLSKPRSLILARCAHQIQALATRNSGPRTGAWPYCWTRAITTGLVLGSRRKDVAVSLSLLIAFTTGDSSSLFEESIAMRWGRVVARYGWRAGHSAERR